MLTVLAYGSILFRDFDNLDPLQDVLRAWTYIDDPCSSGCADCGEEPCRDYPTYSPIIDFAPNNPFITDEEPPAGYSEPPLYRVSVPPIGTRLQVNDILTDLTSTVFAGMSLIDLAEIFAVSGFPRFRVHFEGTSEVELHLIKVPNGGLALIQVDGDPTLIDIVDTNSIGVLDLVSLQTLLGLVDFPESLYPVTIHEVEVQGEGSHFVDVTFLPNIGGAVVVGFGGGLRKVTICGSQQQVEDMTFFDLRANPADPCEIQKRLEPDGEWIAAWRMDNCDSPNEGDTFIQEQNNTIIRNQIINRYDGSDITTIHENLDITTYDDGGDPTRTEALCMAVRTYVESYVTQWIQKCQLVLGLGVFAIVAISSIPFLGWIAGLLIAGGTAYFAAASLAAARDPDALEDVICCMFDSLKGQTITAGNFAISLNGCGFAAGSNSETLRQIVASDLGNEGNWIVFLDALGRAFTLAQAGVSDCPCFEEWTVERLGGDGNADLIAFSYPADAGAAPVPSYDAVNDRYAAGVIGSNRIGVVRLQSATQFRVSEVHMTYSLDFTSGTARGQAISRDFGLTGDEKIVKFVAHSGDVTTTLSATNLNLLVNDISFRWSSGGTGGFARLTRIVVKGRGVNPFAP